MKCSKWKNTGTLIACVLMTVFLLCTCASFDAGTARTVTLGPDELDDTIREASDELNSTVPAESFIGIINIQSSSAALSEYVIDELIKNAVKDRNFTVVDRARLEQIRAEQNFQLSGEVDDDFAVSIGRIIGLQTIVTGSVSSLGSRYRIAIRALNVQTGAVQTQFTKNMAAGETIVALMEMGGAAASSGRSGGAVTSGSQASVGGTAAPAGPAGAKNGIYTFYPRLQPMQAGLPVNNVYIPQVTATRDFIVIHFCRSPTGAWEDGNWDLGGISGFYDQRNFSLQDLDNPSRFYSPVSAQSTNNGMGRIWTLSFNRFTATRFSLSCKPYDSTNPPMIFEEIALGEPDS